MSMQLLKVCTIFGIRTYGLSQLVNIIKAKIQKHKNADDKSPSCLQKRKENICKKQKIEVVDSRSSKRVSQDLWNGATIFDCFRIALCNNEVLNVAGWLSCRSLC